MTNTTTFDRHTSAYSPASTRHALADRLEQGARALIAFASGLTDEEWQIRVPQRRPDGRRDRASRRERLPDGDPAGADPCRRQAGHRRDHGRHQRDERPARAENTRTSRKRRRSICSGRTARPRRRRSARSATSSSPGGAGLAVRRCAAHVPVRARGSRRPSQLSPSRSSSTGVAAVGRSERNDVMTTATSISSATTPRALRRSRPGSRPCGRPATSP